MLFDCCQFSARETWHNELSRETIEQALEYFTVGLDLLGVAAWKRHYPLALSLHEEATEMSKLCGRFELMEKLAGAVKDNAREDLDLANVYQCLIKAYTTRGELMFSHPFFPLNTISLGAIAINRK